MKYRVMDYDLWKYDGQWTVNNTMYAGYTVDIKENDSDKEIIKKLKDCGFLSTGARYSSFRIDGEFGYSLYVEYETSREQKPFCELRPA